MQKTTTFAQKQLNKNLGDIKGPRYIVLLLYTIVAVESKGRKEKEKPHSGEMDMDNPKRKLQRIENDNGGVTDSEFESEPSDQGKLSISEKNDQVVTRKGVGYRSRLSHIFGILGILNEITWHITLNFCYTMYFTD